MSHLTSCYRQVAVYTLYSKGMVDLESNVERRNFHSKHYKVAAIVLL